MDGEFELLRGLQCGVSVLQARQTDAVRYATQIIIFIVIAIVVISSTVCEDQWNTYPLSSPLSSHHPSFPIPSPSHLSSSLLLSPLPSFSSPFSLLSSSLHSSPFSPLSSPLSPLPSLSSPFSLLCSALLSFPVSSYSSIGSIVCCQYV